MGQARRTRRSIYIPSRGRFKGRSFPSKHAYRNALAKAKGFRSDYARRTVYKRISSTRGLNALSPKSRQKRSDALNVVGIMRRNANESRPSGQGAQQKLSGLTNLGKRNEEVCQARAGQEGRQDQGEILR